MQAAQDRQKSYADRKRKPMEFEVGDRVMLKVSPWKGVNGDQTIEVKAGSHVVKVSLELYSGPQSSPGNVRISFKKVKPTSLHKPGLRHLLQVLKLEDTALFTRVDTLADIFTKALAWERFEFLINQLEIKSKSLETLKNLAEEEEE
ncbi:hypothetical protein Tco_0771722 [Tanacetum coccineum]|uniref:Reverse transcriptase domain-containing protein n=1 Tax=Tanacetum coccineum TaxID=301880 RepID=A0ABQ4ZIH1_9ASTR